MHLFKTKEILMSDIFKSKRRLSRKNTKIIMVGFSKEQMNNMSMSFKNRSLAMSCLSRWVLNDLIDKNKSLSIDFQNDKYVFTISEYVNKRVSFLKNDYSNEKLIRRSVVIDNETIDLVQSSCEKYSLFRLLPALTLYAIEKLHEENKVFMQDKSNDMNIYIKAN